MTVDGSSSRRIFVRMRLPLVNRISMLDMSMLGGSSIGIELNLELLVVELFFLELFVVENLTFGLILNGRMIASIVIRVEGR